MDGYAVVANSAGKNARLKIAGEQPAGVSKNLSLSVGKTIRIFTGAPMPIGADAVVMQEETQREGDFVFIQAENISMGDFVRKAGADRNIFCLNENKIAFPLRFFLHHDGI